MLSGKNMEDLVEIAEALSLSLTGKNDKHYMNAELILAVRDHLAAHSELKNNACFASLFSGQGQ